MAALEDQTDGWTQSLSYVVGLKSSAARVEQATVPAFLRRMLAEYGRAQIFEWYQALTVGKVVFDVDGKASETTADALLLAALDAVRAFFAPDEPPRIVLASSHGGPKLSYRVYCVGVRMRMKDVKARILRLGLDGRSGGPFDTAIYSANQKLRAAGSIKTPADARVLKLIDDRQNDLPPTVDLLRDTLVQVVDASWPLLEEDATPPPRAPPTKRARAEALPAPPTADAPSKRPRSGGRRSDVAEETEEEEEEEPQMAVGGYCMPEDRARALRLLADNGFVNPRFVGRPRTTSLTLKADNQARCPCCALDHEAHNWFATQDRDGVLLAKSYSARCRLTPMRPVPHLAVDLEASQALIHQRLDLVERRQGQTEQEVTVIKNTLVDFAPHIEAALDQEIAPASLVMRSSGGGFDFDCGDRERRYDCEIIMNPTCRLSCTSDRTVPPIIAGWAGNTTIHDIIGNPERADTAYVDWFRLHELRQLGVEWCFDKDFF